MSEATTTSAEKTNVVVSVSPHIHSGSSVRNIMLDVIIAMIPAMIASFYFFGWNAARLLIVCVLACVAIEAACRKLMGRNLAIDDLSAIVTGILLAFNLPPDISSGKAIIGCLIAIAVAKQIYGGLGYNPFNPALVGRVAMLVSFPVAMTSWSGWRIPSPIGIDAVTTATPLGLVKTSLQMNAGIPMAFDKATAFQFFYGNINGCIGEVSALALLIGGVYLLIRRCITWHTPVFYIGTVAVFAAILHRVNPSANMPCLFHVLSGGLFLGAIFMATDMVTTPITASGKIVFGVGCGVLTMIIRCWGGYPEGVSFAILIMNGLTPLINRATKPRLFGRREK